MSLKDTEWITNACLYKSLSTLKLQFDKDSPFFATADAPIVLVKAGTIDQANSEMMRVRWKFFHFWKQIPPKDQISLAPCSRCLAQLILDNKE